MTDSAQHNSPSPKRRKRHKLPKLRHHKPTNRAFIEVRGRRHYIGKYGTPEAEQQYYKLLAEIAASGGEPLPSLEKTEITVVEVLAAYWEHAKAYYVHPDGRQTSQLHRVKVSLAKAEKLFGDSPAIEFGPRALDTVRHSWIQDGFTRSSINSMVHALRRAFKWAAAQELIPGSVYENLRTLEGLKRGRTRAKESEKVQPVPLEQIEAVRERVSRQVMAMIDLQLLSAARPGEIISLRPCDIDQNGAVWKAKLEHHKTAYRGKARTLYFGPKAQRIIKEFLIRPATTPLFSPLEAIRERNAKCPNHRHQPVAKPKTKRRVGDRYTIHSYRRAVAVACAAAGIDPAWSPNQLRHTAATTIREAHGLDVAQVILGHSSADTTQIYAAVNEARAVEVIKAIG